MTNNYVSSERRTGGAMKPAEITELFVSIGWIGKLSVRKPLVRLVPFFDKGPGIGH